MTNVAFEAARRAVFSTGDPGGVRRNERLHRAEVEEETIVRLVTEVIVGGHAVPAPAFIAGSHPKEPLRALLAPAHHVGQIVHDPVSVFGVDVRKEGAVEGGVGPVFEKLPGHPGGVADRAVAVQGHHR
jgi:hypothetical protein